MMLFQSFLKFSINKIPEIMRRVPIAFILSLMKMAVLHFGLEKQSFTRASKTLGYQVL